MLRYPSESALSMLFFGWYLHVRSTKSDRRFGIIISIILSKLHLLVVIYRQRTVPRCIRSMLFVCNRDIIDSLALLVQTRIPNLPNAIREKRVIIE